MFTKKDIQDLLNELDLTEAMTIYYEGFTGRGINGVSGHSINIKNDIDINNLVIYIDGYDEQWKTYLIDLKLTERYIKAQFKSHKKDKYDKEFSRIFKFWTVVVPYDKIQSIEIREVK